MTTQIKWNSFKAKEERQIYYNIIPIKVYKSDDRPEIES